MNTFKPKVKIALSDETVFIVSNDDIVSSDLFGDITGNRYAEAGKDEDKGLYFIKAPARPVFAFMLRHTLKHCEISGMATSTASVLKELADKVPTPHAKLSDDKKRLEITIPAVTEYREMMRKVDAAPKPKFHTVPVSRAIEFHTMVESTNGKYPTIKYTKEVEKLFKDPIPGFDGSIDSLKDIDINVLNVIKSDSQSNKQRKASKGTLTEKFKEHGVENLHQLLFEIPRRYIDKSNPQKIHELEVGQSATVIGTVLWTETFNSGRGLNVEVDLTPKEKGSDGKFIKDERLIDAGSVSSGRQGRNSIRASFFAGSWMQNKFKDGSEVIVTGKYKPWRNVKQMTGDTIEFIDSASALPITPIYSQSEKKGITTNVVMRSVQELISRLGHIELPFYLKALYADEKMREKLLGDADESSVMETYAHLIRSIHLPQTMGERERAVKQLAFYELVEMQIIVQSRRSQALEASKNSGLQHKMYDGKAYASARKNLPFELTGSQVEGIEKIAGGMEASSSYQALLSSDVGTGKTICSVLSSLIAVDSGYQAAVIAPTEILARQLYESFRTTSETIDEPWKQGINIVFYTGSMKVKEKREVLAKIKSGEANVIVSTQGLLTGGVEFNDLGFVAIDEQQKFGAEQRSALLESRNDGKIPDILQMTATPIPRSVSQAVYGDIDFISLTDKPAGRLPIKTEWIEEPPRQVVANPVHRIWDDIKKEVATGHKVFIIAPLVEESEKIDASSVETTYNYLKTGALTGINVDFVHGKMKSEEAKQKMLEFKNGTFDVLVASTIVEVGVDITDATRMIILSSDRLGASSLHQIRGRIGRNSLQSRCYLIANEVTDDGASRLQSLVDSDDGFEIAKNDLAIRNEGTLFGTSQSGQSEFKFLKLARHGRWVTRATDAAKYILEQPYGPAAVKVCKEKFEVSEQRML